MNGNILEILLDQASWGAVEETRTRGEQALPTIKSFSENEDFQKRQVAVASAGVLPGEEAGGIVAAGLKDENINVRLAAAHALEDNPNPAASDAVLDVLEDGQDEVLREILALVAGKMPGERTIEVLKKVEAEDADSQISINAQMALARLGSGTAKQAIVSQLEDPLPRTRYNALEKLIYVNDPALARYAFRLLQDRNPAVQVGSVKNPRYRRVCDQAVDTVAFLLQLRVSFRVSTEIIYSDRELQEVYAKIA